MAMKNLEDLLLHELQDIYDAEHQLVKALPKMAKAATNPDLKAGFEQHLEETKGQIERLERAFEQLGKPAKGKKCAAMNGLVTEAEELLKEKADSDVMDAGLIASAQKSEHYEIASYGTVMTWLKTLGHVDITKLLAETLAEEEATDKKLTALAKRVINKQAV